MIKTVLGLTQSYFERGASALTVLGYQSLYIQVFLAATDATVC